MMAKHNLQRLVVLAALILGLGTVAAFGYTRAVAQGPNNGTCSPNHTGSMMGQQGTMSGMMHSMMGQNSGQSSEQCPFMSSMMNGMMGQGIMSNMMHGMMDKFGPGQGMMGAWLPTIELRPTADKPLTLDKAASIAKAYIAAWDSKTKLQLAEVMQFNNHFYGAALETETKRGAFEFLIDPATGTVYAEPGPNMMWNLRYGTMSTHMGLKQANDGEKLAVSPEQAVKYAQDYLDKAQAGAKVEDKPLAFYGFYTLDYQRDGKVIGMLSVNGYIGQVWLHQWHGAFVGETSQQ